MMGEATKTAAPSVLKVAFLWSGFPDYAARCVGRVAASDLLRVSVVATRPSVPIAGMEESLGRPITWLDDPATPTSWSALGVEVPDLLFVSGYRIKAFNSLSAEARRLGAKVVMMSDTNWRGGLRHWIVEPARYRLLFVRRFDGIFVPGQAGERFARYCGFRPSRIRRGVYGADPRLFFQRVPMERRTKHLLFVGQFIERKNVLGLTSAFARFSIAHPEWRLSICGSGPQRNLIEPHPKITVHEFLQPEDLAILMDSARCLVVPSIEEHWGLVLHEAAMSGCAILCSDGVGAGADLVSPANGVTFRPASEKAIIDALHVVAGWSERNWQDASAASLQAAQQFGPEQFAASVRYFLQELF